MRTVTGRPGPVIWSTVAECGDVSGTQERKLERQREVYHDVVAACIAVPQCHAVTFWGLTDKHSWIDEFFGADDPLLFDEL